MEGKEDGEEEGGGGMGDKEVEFGGSDWFVSCYGKGKEREEKSNDSQTETSSSVNQIY